MAGGIRLNGWQRLWLVLTVLGLVGTTAATWIITDPYSPAEMTYEWQLRRELDGPGCDDYKSLPLPQLPEPAFSWPCYHIYLSRRFSETGRTPYTIDVYHADKAAFRNQEFRTGLLLFGGAFIVLSLLTYGAGLTIGWIVRGFRASGEHR